MAQGPLPSLNAGVHAGVHADTVDGWERQFWETDGWEVHGGPWDVEALTAESAKNWQMSFLKMVIFHSFSLLKMDNGDFP